MVKEGLDLNVPPVVTEGWGEAFSAFRVSGNSVILDTVKPAEDGSSDLVLRLYDSLKSAGPVEVEIDLPVKKAELTDMLEDPLEELALEETGNGVKLNLTFRAFEIKTVRLSF